MRCGLAFDQLETVGKPCEFGQTLCVLIRFDQGDFVGGKIEVQRRQQLPAVNLGGVSPTGDGAGGIIGIGSHAKLNLSPICLGSLQ